MEMHILIDKKSIYFYMLYIVVLKSREIPINYIIFIRQCIKIASYLSK
jgi:hypothetical protein